MKEEFLKASRKTRKRPIFKIEDKIKG